MRLKDQAWFSLPSGLLDFFFLVFDSAPGDVSVPEASALAPVDCWRLFPLFVAFVDFLGEELCAVDSGDPVS